MEIDLDKIDDTVLGLLWLYEPYGVRTAGWISLGGCQPNRVQASSRPCRVDQNVGVEDALEVELIVHCSPR